MRNHSSSNIKARLNALKTRHLMTSRTIREENSRVNPDNFLLQDLKRRRLKLKDEIAGYSFV
jgi:hypothetical protein